VTPENLKYSSDHAWVRVEGNKAVVGITEYFQNKVGDVVYIDLPAEGEKIKQHGRLAEIEAINAVSQLYAPFSGEVLEVNDELQHSPEFLNQDPFRRGWIALIEWAKREELDHLMTAEEYNKIIGV